MSMIWVVLGAGNLIRDIQDTIVASGYFLKCVVVNQELPLEIKKKIVAPIIQLEDFKPETRDQHLFGFVNPNKEAFIQKLPYSSVTYGNLIHPRAYIARDVKFGYGNYIGAMSVIAPGTNIGDFNYINRAVSIGHDVQIGDFNTFSPGATICGNCQIGNKNYFGANSTLIDGKIIKDKITIGAGGVVHQNIMDSGTYVGVPIKKILK